MQRESKSMSKLGLFFSVSILLTAQAHAGVYSFGDGCASLGSWSKQALQQTQRIMGIVDSLRNDPNCKGIETIIPKIQFAAQSLTTPEGEAARADRIETIPNELAALRSFLVASPELKDQVLKLMGSRKLEAASLAAEKGAASGAASAEVAKMAGEALGMGAVDPAMIAIAMGIQDIKARTERSLSVGIDMLDQSLDVLPALDRCLLHAPSQGMALVAAMVKLGAAFTSSQDGIANRMSHVIAKLVTFVRNRKFMKALSQLDETEFWLSLSCLVETTSQTYCAARDAHKLLDFGLKEMKPMINKTGSVDVENPLAGYYILTRDIPKVSGWIQKIQFGIEPKLSSDANFKNRVWRDVTTLMTSINDLKGLYNEELLTFSTLPDVESRKTAILRLVGKITTFMTGGGGGGEDSGGSRGINFFTQGTLGGLIPYKLVGLPGVPAECRATDKRDELDWPRCLNNGGNWHTVFNADPAAFIRTIGNNLDNQIAQAVNRASLFFQQRMIVDMSNLVNESVTSQAYTVVASFRRISSYLAGLDTRIMAAVAADESNEESLILIPSIRDTKQRIDALLEMYTVVKQAIQNGATNSEEARAQLNAAYKGVINTAYDQFNVLLQRDTFLPSRLSTFIHHDYAMRIRNRDDISRWEKDLLLETGNDLLYRLLEVSNTNPTQVKNDIETALVINRRNLGTVEYLFKDNLKDMIGQLHYVATGTGSTRVPGFRESYDYYQDEAKKNPVSANPFSQAWGYLWSFWTPTQSQDSDAESYLPWARTTMYADNQYRPRNTALFKMADDEHKSFANMKARICALTLAFEDRNAFQTLCKGAVLPSAFDTRTEKGPRLQIPLDLYYDNYTTPEKRTRPVTADSICAFQTYNRRNLVFWMTLDMENR